MTAARTVWRSQHSQPSVGFGFAITDSAYGAGAACCPSCSGLVCDTRNQESATTVRRVLSIMIFCVPVAKRFGHTSQRMMSRAVLAAMDNEHKVCWVIGEVARDDK